MTNHRKTSGWRRTIAVSAAFVASLSPITAVQDNPDNLRDNEPLYMRDISRPDGPNCTTIAELRSLAEKDTQEFLKCAVWIMNTPYRGILYKYQESNVERDKIIALRLTLEKTVIPIAAQFLTESDEKKDVEFLSRLNDSLLKGLISAGEVRSGTKECFRPTLEDKKIDVEVILGSIEKFNDIAQKYGKSVQELKQTTIEAVQEVDAILVGVAKKANAEWQQLSDKGDNASKKEKKRMDKIRNLMAYLFQRWFQNEKIVEFRKAAEEFLKQAFDNTQKQKGFDNSQEEFPNSSLSATKESLPPASVTRQPSVAALGGGSTPRQKASE